MIVVIGGGVVGLACGLSVARRKRAVCVIERHARAGQESSTHNSGVIHAGLYHPLTSLKTRLCHEGRERLYAFCDDHGVPHLRCGKLIVAGPGDESSLDELIRNAEANGANLHEVDLGFVRDREPHVAATRAAWSPDTGWLDADAYVQRLAAELERHGGVLLRGTPATAVTHRPGGLAVTTPRETIDAEIVVNAAGLWAHQISAMAGGEPFVIYPCRGEYAELAPHARSRVRGLVYPVPHPSGHGLGVHLTRTATGAVWIGPTIRYQNDPADYERDRLPLDAFVEPTRRLLPSVTLADLRLGGSGIRAKLHPPGERFADFLIRRDARVPHLIHAAGIDSPGLTASLAIGEYVADIAVGR
ncbi:MAG TPA: FAD-dependent oxidoreductase [Vicinamibacterales bacterium]|nr:FAD-dependent oxidoreductase [Vicinamibacterales bacterium]